MYTLYIANKTYSTWSLRPWILMRQMGIPFQEKLVPFGAVNDFRDFSPSGMVPCLVDGETVVWDSLAIVEYLAERVPGVWPADPIARAWARSAAAEMHSGFADLRGVFSMICGLRVRIDSYPPALLAQLARIEEIWIDGLARFAGPFLAGATFSAVDAFYAPLAFRFQTYQPRLSERSQQYVNKLLELTSMQEWYTSALGEVWRDDSHETGVRRVGTVLEDHRQATG